MTIGSASFLPGHGQEAPILPYRSFRSTVRRPLASRLSAASAPWRQRPATALAEDPPRGRILVAADDAPLTLNVQRILRDAGYRAVGPASSDDDVARLVGCRPIDGAIVDLQLAGGAAAVIAGRLERLGVPFVRLAEPPLDAPAHADGFAPVVAKPIDGGTLVRALEGVLGSSRRARADSFYPVSPPQEVWPRVFPQL